MWYVNNYLLPSIKAQGIDDVAVKCDTKHVGNLENCMDIFAHITTPDGVWHLQDDVIICRDFKKRTEEFNSAEVVCGFVSNHEVDKPEGYVKPQEMWWSFPCIYIPNNLARECANWYYDEARWKGIYSWMVGTKKYDDYFFMDFLSIKHPDQKILNLKPCLVDHIDYLIGGTTINDQRKRIVRAKWFEDPDLVDELNKKLENGNKTDG